MTLPRLCHTRVPARQVPPQLFSADALGLAEAGSGEARRGMERLNSADEARASMQRARSAEATLSGMTLGAGGGDASLGRRSGRLALGFRDKQWHQGCACGFNSCGRTAVGVWRKLLGFDRLSLKPGLTWRARASSRQRLRGVSSELGAGGRLPAARAVARTLSGGLQNIAEDAPGAGGAVVPEESVATLARMLQAYEQGQGLAMEPKSPMGSPPDHPAKARLGSLPLALRATTHTAWLLCLRVQCSASSDPLVKR